MQCVALSGTLVCCESCTEQLLVPCYRDTPPQDYDLWNETVGLVPNGPTEFNAMSAFGLVGNLSCCSAVMDNFHSKLIAGVKGGKC